MSVTLNQLHSFLAVMRNGSVRAAAEELVVTPPSVSSAVSALAEELGVALFERDGRGVRPTAAGIAFEPYAADVIGLLGNGQRAAREAAKQARHVLRIAAVTTAAESFVPGLMHAFALRHPDVGLTLRVGNRDRVMAHLLGHESDVAFTGRPPEDDRIEAEAIGPNELVLITAPDDPMTRRRGVKAAELAGYTWLLREPGSGTRAVNEDFLAGGDLHVPTLALGSNGAIRQAARAGLGISFVSYAAVADDIAAGLVGTIDVRPRPAQRDWHMLRSRVGPRRDLVDDFCAFVRETGVAGPPEG